MNRGQFAYSVSSNSFLPPCIVQISCRATFTLNVYAMRGQFFSVMLIVCMQVLPVDSCRKPTTRKPKTNKFSLKDYKTGVTDIQKAIKDQDKNWKANVNPEFENSGIEDLTSLLGAKYVPEESRPKPEPPKHRKKPRKPAGYRTKRAPVALPPTYDSRVYSICKSIGSVRYQYSCGSCWAMTATSVISDRHCIYNYQAQGQKYMSTMHAISCISPGCKDGLEYKVFEYWIKSGLVTGGIEYGPANQPVGCLPYPKNINDTPSTCPTKCSASYNKSFEADKTYGALYYQVPKNATAIKEEIYYYGPVTTFFRAYDDFLYYSGGYHILKLIGWGTENGTQYWIGVNTWGTGWGDKGLFKIRLGVNEVGIEERIYGVLPKEAFPS